MVGFLLIKRCAVNALFVCRLCIFVILNDAVQIGCSAKVFKFFFALCACSRSLFLWPCTSISSMLLWVEVFFWSRLVIGIGNTAYWRTGIYQILSPKYFDTHRWAFHTPPSSTIIYSNAPTIAVFDYYAHIYQSQQIKLPAHSPNDAWNCQI